MLKEILNFEILRNGFYWDVSRRSLSSFTYQHISEKIILKVLLVFFILFLGITLKAAPYPIKVAGERHTLVLLSDGTVVGWGEFEHGELGPITNIPKKGNSTIGLVSIKLPGKAIDIAAGESSSFAVLEDGSVVGWGLVSPQMFGNGVDRAKLSNGIIGFENPVKISNLSNIVQISAGFYQMMALRNDGTVYYWKQTKRGIYVDSAPPIQINGLKGIEQISASATHLMALDNLGQVWTWGDTYHGALGRKSNGEKPEKVSGLNNVKSISAGNGVSTVVKKDGTVWVWGSNFNAQFGNGKRTDAPVIDGLSNEIETTPQQVPGVSNAIYVTCGFGGRHTIVLLKDGTLRGWGNTDWGQLGVGISATFLEKPVTPKISGVKTVFAVRSNTYAVKNDNSFWIWGSSYRGSFPLSANAKVPVPLDLK